ncbi:MAG TPA: hypothetical protein VLA34_07910 [Candidatus Krumholzibacterium sp.]|nr:hypothetical protein [Candidatus Krumholzibacterium sp.]
MPRVGVYPLWENDLLWFFLEHYPAVSNRELLHDVIMNPLYEIRQQFKENKGHPYILREKHRKWCNQIEARVGDVPMPTWNEMMDDQYWEDDCPLCSMLFEEHAEWYLFGDDHEIVYSIINSIYDSITLEGTAQEVVNQILAAPGSENITELFVAAHDDDRLYVIRSNRTSACAEIIELQGDVRGAVADALQDGPHETYVLPEDTLTELSKWVTANGQGDAA